MTCNSFKCHNSSVENFDLPSDIKFPTSDIVGQTSKHVCQMIAKSGFVGSYDQNIILNKIKCSIDSLELKKKIVLFVSLAARNGARKACVLAQTSAV
jgi:hypothetical protein